jgi:hypothetical protein
MKRDGQSIGMRYLTDAFVKQVKYYYSTTKRLLKLERRRSQRRRGRRRQHIAHAPSKIVAKISYANIINNGGK